MKKKTRQKIMLFFLLILMLVTYSYRFFYRSINREQYFAIKVGMTADEVKKQLGEPVKRTRYFCFTHGSSEVWRYNIKYSILAVSVWFRPDENKKMRVFDKSWGFE